MLTRIMKKKDDRDAGFTLIELLVVVAIIGILAAIAIPVFLSQRNSARDASVKSDLNTVAQFMETSYTVDNQWPVFTTGALVADLAGTTVGTSPQNEILVTYSAPGEYVITGCNAESGVLFTYDSSAGGMSAATTAPGCTASATQFAYWG